MVTVLRCMLVCLALLSLAVVGTACGGSDTAETTAETAAGDAAAVTTSDAPETEAVVKEEPAGGSMESPEAASVTDAFKAMAATKGIYFGEVPEGFPLDIIPLHPDGEIDKSSVNEEDFTLLQRVSSDKDAIFAWYKKHFDGLGWAAGDPFTFSGRTMVSFEGSDGEVSMTMTEQDDGKIFTSLVLSPK